MVLQANFKTIWYKYCNEYSTILVIIILGLLNFLSVFPLLSIPITDMFDLVHLNVNVGQVNGSLSLGTFGYCLKASDQNICQPSPRGFPYAISQFFSNHRIS